jgi:glucokinase
MSSAPVFVGVDIGGTRMSVGLVGHDGRIMEVERFHTPRQAGADACLRELLQVTRRLIAEARMFGKPKAIGIGFGGPVDSVAGTVRRSHHVGGWAGLPIAELFAEATGLPVFLENDANAGALAEAIFGAGRGQSTVLYVNVGTGIGGGLVVNRRIYGGAHSFAGEIGHIVLLPGGPLCPCGKRGCLEALASGEAIGRRADELREAGELGESALASITDLTGRVVGEYAVHGDEAARRIVAEAGRFLGWALAIACNLLDPDVIVVGGGVAALGPLYIEPARCRFRELVIDLLADVPILPAALGYDAGVVGAAAVAMLSTK